MPGNVVQSDLHKYFKLQKNINQDGQRKLLKSEGISENINKIATVKNENETGNKNILQLTKSPERQSSSKENPQRKRKQQQLEELIKNDGLSPFAELKAKKQEKQPCSVKKKLKLDEATPKIEKTDDSEGSCSRAKLNPDEIKKQLGKCSRLDELRNRLLKLNKCEENLKAFRSQCLVKDQKLAKSPSSSPQKTLKSPLKRLTHTKNRTESSLLSPRKTSILGPTLKQFSVIDVEVPVSPQKSPAKLSSPLKTLQRTPAYERFSHLAEPTTETSQLTLPYRYQLMKEVFRAVDTVVSLLHNRHELITFPKLKPAVQEMLRKTFSETHLGQLKTVFPFAYFFNQEKIVSKQTGSYNSVSYELTVKPNFDYKQLPSKENFDDISAACKYRKMDSVVLIERRHIFHNALLDILKKRHQDFLQKLDPPVVLSGTVRRWHPDFPLEEIEPPLPSALPKPPSNDTPKTAQDVMDKARDIFYVNNRMKIALETAAASTVKTKYNDDSQKSVANPQVAAALKGVSLSLLEKIRSREAAKAARDMARSDKDDKHLEMLSRLPELARILRNLFVVEKKAALPWETVITKISSSHSNMISAGEVEVHLKLLIEKVPNWCQMHKVRSGLYLKLDKTKELNDIVDFLNKLIKEHS